MVKRIAIFARNPSGRGGIEIVVSRHLKIFQDHGCECLLFGQGGCEHVIPISGAPRREALRKLMESFAPDVCVLHGATHVGMHDDKTVFDELGIPTVAVCHFSFPSAMLLEGEERVNGLFLEAARLCDIVVTVSALDAIWWRSLGLNAVYVQNPVGEMPERGSFTREPPGECVNLLWVGRQAEQKQPNLALEVLAKVQKEIPDVHLTMVGGSEEGWRTWRKSANKLGVSANVTFRAQMDDLTELWAKTDIHLLTSITESFCLVLAEAKARGIPTAMFEIPFLDLVKNREGIATAPQGDVDGLAAQIVALATNPSRRLSMGQKARESLAGFNDEAVWQRWTEVFDMLRGEGGTVLERSELTDIVTQEFGAWNRFCEKNLWLLRMNRDLVKLSRGTMSFRGVAVFLSLAECSARKLRNILKGHVIHA